jgi:hypothetical protein
MWAVTDYLFAIGIVQDDTDELAVEISKQAQIYQNGAVTILAGGARSANDGFLQRRKLPYPRCRMTIRLPGPDAGDRTLLLDYHTPLPVTEDPIDNRAWIFQEGKSY